MKDGILIIDKPQWYTSFDVVAKVRKLFGTKKVGHTGTLDPMATGVLVICIGKATGLVNELTCEDKIYRTTIKLGIKTDSDDMTGRILQTFNDNSLPNYNDCKDNHLSNVSKMIFETNLHFANGLKYKFENDDYEKVIKSFIGKQKQIPSIYSSIKVNGKKLYEYARSGEHIDIPVRDIEIFDIYDISFNGKDEISYTVHCSKGTYIRTLNENITKKLGVIGTTLVLKRVKTGQFDIEDATKLENINEEKIIPIDSLFNEKIMISERDTNKLLNGISIDITMKDGTYNVYSNDKYLGLGKVKNGQLKRYIIL